VFDDISGGETIATLSFVDIATTSTYQWELSDTRFEVVGNELKLKVGETLDYISDSTINLSVTLQTDIYENPTQVITIQVKDRINYVAEGSTGVDTIVGTTDDDWIYGNQGNDILTGGASRDVFVYKGLDGSDTITDFDASVGGDQVDLRELLSFNPGDTLSNFISFNNDGTNITLKIDSDGGNNFVSPDVEIYLDNYITSIASPLTLDDLENNNFIL
jgi:Ca2+-binding RTX toxin-like protein